MSTSSGLRKKVNDNFMRLTERNLVSTLKVLYPKIHRTLSKDGIRSEEADLEGSPWWIEVYIVEWYVSESVRRKLVEGLKERTDGRPIMVGYRLYCPLYTALLTSHIIIEYDTSILYDFPDLVYDREVVFFRVDGRTYIDMSSICFLRSIRDNEACREAGNRKAHQRAEVIKRTRKE